MKCLKTPPRSPSAASGSPRDISRPCKPCGSLAHKAQESEHVISRSSRGRPCSRATLAGDGLRLVQAPTRLIVGGRDQPVIRMNEEALFRLGAPVKQLVIVPGATHLFEE